MFHMPAYDKFDVPARYIMTFGFAVSVLAGLGIAAIEHRSASRRCVGVGIDICIAFVLLDLILIVLLPGSLRLLPPTTGGPWPARVFSDPAILLPLFMLLLSTVSLLYWTILPASRWRQAIILLVLIVDLGSFGWVELSGHQYPSFTVTEPPMYAEHLKGKLSSRAQRILPVAGGLGRSKLDSAKYIAGLEGSQRKRLWPADLKQNQRASGNAAGRTNRWILARSLRSQPGYRCGPVYTRAKWRTRGTSKQKRVRVGRV